jgi:hypothetical protein
VGGGVFSDFKAKPQFARDDADTTLFFLSANTIIFERPVDDPFFSAHQVRHSMSNQGNETIYITDNPAGILGCVEQVKTQALRICSIVLTLLVPILQYEGIWRYRVHPLTRNHASL